MNKKRTIKMYNIEFEVSEKEYKEFVKIRDRYKYLKILDRKHNLISFEALHESRKMENLGGQDILVDVEEFVINKMMVEKLRVCISQLSPKELYLIENLIYQAKSEREVAQISGIAQKTINDSKRKLLKKLKKLLGN